MDARKLRYHLKLMSAEISRMPSGPDKQVLDRRMNYAWSALNEVDPPQDILAEKAAAVMTDAELRAAFIAVQQERKASELDDRSQELFDELGRRHLDIPRTIG